MKIAALPAPTIVRMTQPFAIHCNHFSFCQCLNRRHPAHEAAAEIALGQAAERFARMYRERVRHSVVPEMYQTNLLGEPKLFH